MVAINLQLVDGTKTVGIAIAQKVIKKIMEWNPQTIEETICVEKCIFGRTREFTCKKVVPKPDDLKTLITSTVSRELSRFLQMPADDNSIPKKAQELADFCVDRIEYWFKTFPNVFENEKFKVDFFEGFFKYQLWSKIKDFSSG